jgi:coenzyme PQQ biosynthesis protein C
VLRYWKLHPFHLHIHRDELTRGQLQAWVLNRYFYQSRIPIKDSLLLAKSDNPAFCRAWRKRILDHDGDQDGHGGVERGIQLAESSGLSRDHVIPCDGILPGVRYAVDAYLAPVRDSPLLIAVRGDVLSFLDRMAERGAVRV